MYIPCHIMYIPSNIQKFFVLVNDLNNTHSAIYVDPLGISLQKIQDMNVHKKKNCQFVVFFFKFCFRQRGRQQWREKGTFSSVIFASITTRMDNSPYKFSRTGMARLLFLHTKIKNYGCLTYANYFSWQQSSVLSMTDLPLFSLMLSIIKIKTYYW